MNPPIAEIFSQGDEVITGEIADTNAAWLARELAWLGFDILRHSAVGDRLQAMTESLREIARRADLCICTGGLGPTCDDLTAEAASLAFDRPLRQDEDALRQMEAFFLRLERDMPISNRKQAWLPDGAQRIDNLWGTAPGFSLCAERCHFVFLPGVPSEMKSMFEHGVRADLARRFLLRPARLVVLRTVGIGESALQEKIDQIPIPSGIRLGFQTGGPENRVKLLFPAEFSEADIGHWVDRVAAAIGEEVYCIAGMGETEADLKTLVGRELSRRGASLYAVETVSGGYLAHLCAGEPWFLGALVASGREHLWLGADSGDAGGIAEQARSVSGADYVLAQAVAEPAVSECRNLAVHLAVAGPDGVHAEIRRIGGHRQRLQAAAAAWGLDLLRRRL